MQAHNLSVAFILVLEESKTGIYTSGSYYDYLLENAEKYASLSSWDASVLDDFANDLSLVDDLETEITEDIDFA